MGFSARSWVRTASEYRYYKSFVPHLTWIHSTSSPYSVAVMNLYLGSRRSMASSSTAAAADPVKEDFPEALTYRYNDNSAWVPAAKSHEASHFCQYDFLPRVVDGGMLCCFCSYNRRPLTSQNTPILNYGASVEIALPSTLRESRA